MKSILFEIERFRGSKLMKTVIVFILLISSSMIYFSASKYKNNLKQKEAFIKFEETKVKMCNNYQQYGITGIRLTHDITPLIILFRNTNVLESLVSTSDIIDIYNSRRGRNNYDNQFLFSFSFSDFLFLMSILSLYYGITTFTGINPRILYRRWPQMISSVLSRLFLFNLFVIALFALVYFEIILLGIKMTWNETGIILLFLLYTLVYYGIFFLIGVSINVCKWKAKIAIMIALWFITIFFIPAVITKVIETRLNKCESLDTFQILKFTAMMNFEKMVQNKYEELLKVEKNPDIDAFVKKYISYYFKTLFRSNLEKEKKFMLKDEKILRWKERTASIYPSNYFQFIAREFSGTGDNCYIDFQRFILEKRTKFIIYINQKRHFENDSTVEKVSPLEENIYNTKIVVPGSYPGSLLYNLALLMLILLSIVFQIRKTFPKSSVCQNLENQHGFFFQYFETREDLKNEIDKVIKTGCPVLMIDKSDITIIQRDKMKLKTVLRYFCYIRDIKVEEVEKNLMAYNLKSKIITININTIKSLVAAIIFAESASQFYVMEYIKGESHDFDENTRKIFQSKINEGKRIVYYTMQFPEMLIKKEKRKSFSIGNMIALNIMDYSLR